MELRRLLDGQCYSHTGDYLVAIKFQFGDEGATAT